MQLHEITSEKTSKDRRRVGRGIGSGMGKTSGRGTKGQKSRTGGGVPAHFEGGQTPIIRRLPKHKGFRRPHRPVTFVINLTHLAQFADNGLLTLKSLTDRGYLNSGERVKILGSGEITTAVRVEANAISHSAKSKIEAAGGTVTII
ncbi:50S ribosomal protein L15 [candidate division Kazan bacterium RIFCSPHIGHO2_01_FULL_49_10]|uniref:Large ribosomal subunit protein uL15 n=1 Tax=candidate division Kazan bacterium RIFCSPLOWO2_01_FULL_48_13 TaxID=1798539 RepID=A0A1F4PPN6_UNCK3|nr:MAG: 50S ribosomal protein L15 [candidate division Kazan bacterium RIFCSPHIGHO2_01_FULL_49_10]OGB85641.1 MAG: 50S ribosomal protein L15 [candidate division Kazan bacterium RIFCSPLOWO2_01_FULL_48_13]